VQRFPVVVRLERLESEELPRALAEAGERGPVALNDGDFDKLMLDLKSDDRSRQSQAAQRLMTAAIEERAVELLPIARRFIAESDPSQRYFAIRVLARAATQDDVPLLLRMLKADDQGSHHELIQAIRRLKDNRAIRTLSDLIANGEGSGYAAAEALGDFGPAAEDAALELLKEKHAETRRFACQILQKTGSEKSIKPLQNAMTAGNQNLMHTAAEALRAVRSRVGGSRETDQ
jgi:HEAT repeat protein